MGGRQLWEGGDRFLFEDPYFDSSCANFSEKLKVIDGIRGPRVSTCHGESRFTPVVPHIINSARPLALLTVRPE